MKKLEILILLAILFIALIWIMFCANPLEPEKGFLNVTLQWGSTSPTVTSIIMQADSQTPKTDVTSEHLIGKNTGDSTLQKSGSSIVPAGIVKIKFTLQPGDIVAEFNVEEDTFRIQTVLGIFNITAQGLTQEGIIRFTGDISKILVEPHKITHITFTMEPNYPTEIPQFIGVQDTSVYNVGYFALTWNSCSKATEYVLEEDNAASFDSSTVLYKGPDTTFAITNKTEGLYFYRVKATNEIDESPWSTSAIFQVVLLENLVIVTQLLDDCIPGETYSQSLEAAGGMPPYTWTLIEGTVPIGLSFSTDGVISGSSYASTITYSFTVRVTDQSNPVQTVEKSFNINVVNKLQIWTITLSPAQVDSFYQTTISTSGGQRPLTCEVITGNLPEGLELTSEGIVTGTPTESGIFEFTLQITDNSRPPQTAIKQYSLLVSEITDSLVIVTMSLPDGQVNKSYRAVVQAANGSPPFSWSITDGNLPSGLDLEPSDDDSVEITGYPEDPETSIFTLEVQDSSDPQQRTRKSFSITIEPESIEIATTSLPSGTVGESYSASICAQGGSGDYTWELTEVSLPPGLTSNPSNGCIEIQGTPSDSGQYFFSVEVRDNQYTSLSDTMAFSITVSLIISPIQIITESLPNGMVDNAYNTSICADGGTLPYTWEIIEGRLPLGVETESSMSDSHCLDITGTPSEWGTFDFTTRVTDAGSPQRSDTNQYTIIIDPLILQITTESPLPDGEKGTYYNQKISARGGSGYYTWGIIDGSLPPGMVFRDKGSYAYVRSTPKKSGIYSFTIEVTDSVFPDLSDNKIFTLTITELLNITTESLPGGKIDEAYFATVCAENGEMPYIFSIETGSLPDGLSPDFDYSDDCMSIDGIPTTDGIWTFTVNVTDNKLEEASKELSITITPLRITTTSLPDGTAGEYYNQDIYAEGGTGICTFSVIAGSLPPGLILESWEGENASIYGIVTGSGTFDFTVQVTDGTYSDTQSYSVTMAVAPPLEITTTTLEDGQMGDYYYDGITADGGYMPYDWSITVGSLPPGLYFENSSYAHDSNIEILGTPTAYGTYNFTFEVTDSDSPQETDTQDFSLIIDPAPVNITTKPYELDTGTEGVSYSDSIYAEGGSSNYNWSVISGSLPPGLSLTVTSGIYCVISGTPTLNGSYGFTIKAQDDAFPELSDNKFFSIGILIP